MALINLGSVATDIRGSVAGVTFSRNKGGSYVRQKISPVQPRTPAQTLVRANFAANSKLWSGTLTVSQRAAWSFFAQANPFTNVFGNSIIISGMAIMQKLNQVLAQIGVAPIVAPPPDLSVPALAAPSGITADTTGPDLEVNTAAQSVVAGAKYYIFATKPLAAGRTPTSSDFRFIAAKAGVAAATTIDITSDYFGIFGSAAPGQTVGVLVATVNVDTGALTPGLRFIEQFL